jgi:cellulose synthase/poly-beta-1,6-N-acetylglucosamine synthase-like glycosyltransferase
LIVLQLLYSISAFGLALVGFNALVLLVIYLSHRREKIPQPVVADEDNWPSVVVQLPIYNERHVVERLIEAVTRLDYPRDRLTVQLLDDSDDETAAIAASAVRRARRAGLRIDHVRRDSRTGYKAGALAHGFTLAEADFIAIFDADFVPQPDFLRRVIPYFLDDPGLGMVQTRWGHLNPGYSSLTCAQALALDTHFVIEQTARQRGGLLMNFSGTGGVWRRTCIQDSGGWHYDTLSEDIDLSYRAQLRGWRCLYLPEISVPAEIPPLVMAFKRQQSRWATGTIQCLRKLGPTVLASHLTIWQKLQAMLHLGGYFIHPLMLLLLLSTLPLLLTGQLSNLPLAGLSLAMLGPPLQMIVAQSTLYPDWKRRLLHFPVLMLLGVGIAVNNLAAVLRGFSSRPHTFRRTPKFHIRRRGQTWAASAYVLPADYTTWLEIALSLYSGVTAVLALQRAPALAPFMALYALGFAYVAGAGLWQTRTARRVQAHRGHRLGLSGTGGD